ncbi:DUF305 domain-containing protein [Negadavirga shengliensis]|uniref:DUF305 domain-containing protein n=1 Tax=Negadavirga shengliensis TaxID=1389218 RepID=A0ABV9SZM3_9BACT
MKNTNYQKFLIMLTASFMIMYAVMYLNVDTVDHVYLSTTRLYMTSLMVAPMSLIMLTVMKGMYQNRKLNLLIVGASITVFVMAFILLRTQTPIGDKQYMKAMIPHHSSAILTSEEADIRDPEVKKLAEEIIKTQKEEIAQMKKILDRMEE